MSRKPATRRLARTLLVAWVAVVAGATAHGARASERSALLFSQGVEEFREGTDGYRTALDLFDRAVESDPSDIQARYYRGVTRARLGQLDGAVDDLRQVLSERPGFDQAALELGIVYVERRQYEEALVPLHQAKQSDSLAPAASFYIGLAELRLGWLERAKPEFERARAPDAPPDLVLPATYYLGVIAAHLGQTAEARDDLTVVAERRPDTDMGRAAAEYLAEPTNLSTLDYEVHGFAKIEYDSNAVLAPSDTVTREALAISRESDGRSRLGVGGSFAAWRGAGAEIRLGYDFGQVLYFHLTDFNLQEHQPYVSIAGQSGPWSMGLVARYDYDIEDTSSFLEQVSVLPWVRLAEGTIASTEVSYRARWRSFYQLNLGPSLDAWNQAATLQQNFYLDSKQRYLFVGYRFDDNQGIHPPGDAFSYDGNEADAGVVFAFPEVGIRTNLAYRYRNESFNPASQGRHDHENALTFQLRKAILPPNLFLSLEYFGTFHDSNQPEFAYNRDIGSIGLEVEY